MAIYIKPQIEVTELELEQSILDASTSNLKLHEYEEDAEQL